MRFLVVLTMLIIVGISQAQPDVEMNDDQIVILNAINRSRIRDNLVHLVPNPVLNQIAATYVNDLAARPINSLGDVFLTSNSANLNDLLTQFGYTPYSNGYVADFIPIVIRDFAPSQIVDTWINDFSRPEAERTLLSRRMIREGERLLPFFSPLYREIGIAALFNESSGRYYYVIIFGAQPNVLPVVVAERTAINQIAQAVFTQDVLLYIHDERIYRNGDVEAIGAVRTMRIAEQPGEQTCPTNVAASDLTGGWERYTNEVRWMLSDGAGVKTIYVQMCDNRGRTITMSTRVNYLDETAAGTVMPFNGTATPDVIGIANATQTAAASATSYAPYLATVESILTATAAAP